MRGPRPSCITARCTGRPTPSDCCWSRRPASRRARLALAWLAAWPLTQLGLLAQPALLHYGGLSGVLHAGVAVAALHLAWRGGRGERWIGAALLGGLALKVASEAPWGAPLRHPAGWDIAVAPAAHACGLVAGLLYAAVALAWNTGRRR